MHIRTGFAGEFWTTRLFNAHRASMLDPRRQSLDDLGRGARPGGPATFHDPGKRSAVTEARYGRFFNSHEVCRAHADRVSTCYLGCRTRLRHRPADIIVITYEGGRVTRPARRLSCRCPFSIAVTL